MCYNLALRLYRIYLTNGLRMKQKFKNISTMRKHYLTYTIPALFISACNSGVDNNNIGNHVSVNASTTSNTTPQYLYAANASAHGIDVYKVTPESITAMESIPTPGYEPTSIAFNESTSIAYVATSTNTILTINTSGNYTTTQVPANLTRTVSPKTLTNAMSVDTSISSIVYSAGYLLFYSAQSKTLYEFKNFLDSNPTIVNTAAGAISGMAFAAIGNHLITTNSAANTETLSDLNGSTGSITFDSIHTGNKQESEPYGVAMSTDGKYAYVAERGSKSISILKVESDSLTQIAGITTTSSPLAAAISLDGAKLFVSTDTGIETYEIIQNGLLNRASIHSVNNEASGLGAASFLIQPNNPAQESGNEYENILYAINQSTNEIETYNIDESGNLNQMGPPLTESSTQSITSLTADKNHLFGSDSLSNSIDTLNINSNDLPTNTNLFFSYANYTPLNTTPSKNSTAYVTFKGATNKNTIGFFSVGESGAITFKNTAISGNLYDLVQLHNNGLTAFATNMTTNTIDIFSINQDDYSFTKIGEISGAGQLKSIATDPKSPYLYALYNGSNNDEGHIDTYNTTNPSTPYLISTIGTGRGNGKTISLASNTAYVTNTDGKGISRFSIIKGALTNAGNILVGKTISAIATLTRKKHTYPYFYAGNNGAGYTGYLVQEAESRGAHNLTNGIQAADYLCQLEADSMTVGSRRPKNTYHAMIVDGQNRIACRTANCNSIFTQEHHDWVFAPNSVYRDEITFPSFTTGFNALPNGRIPPLRILTLGSNSTSHNNLFGRRWYTGMNQDYTTNATNEANVSCNTWTKPHFDTVGTNPIYGGTDYRGVLGAPDHNATIGQLPNNGLPQDYTCDFHARTIKSQPNNSNKDTTISKITMGLICIGQTPLDND